MPTPPNKLTTDYLGRLIYEIHGQRVMLDSDLAAIYGVETRTLNQAVRRNRERFPKDFAFQVSSTEWENLKYQIGTLKSAEVKRATLRSQNVTLKGGRGQHRKYLPYVFTEHGAIMAANVGHSRRRALASYPCCHTAYPHGSRSRVFSIAPRAVQNEYDVRGRRWMDCIGRMVMRPSEREIASQATIVTILQRVMDVIDPPALPPPLPKPRIGFKPS